MSLDVLAVAAHPDDVEISVGGTLIKLAGMGYSTGIVDLTRGEASTRGTPEMRDREAHQAMKVLGCSLRENLGLPDSRITVDDDSVRSAVRMLRRLRPRILLTQFWDDPHPDHSNTSQLLRKAAHLSGLKKFDEESGNERFRPHAIAHFLFPRTVAPTFIVDTSAEAARKWEALKCHASQFYDPESPEPGSRVSSSQFLSEIEARDRYFGAMIGVEHGEAFYVREALNVTDPVLLLSARMNMYS
jgi:bacillithiol biosynthesis deacetylase BshB1